MFTGLVEETGIINSTTSIGGGKRLSIKANKIFDDLKIDDSVSINGVCLTAVSVRGNIFEVEAVEETIRKTTIGKLGKGSKVNLERALKLSNRLGGHIVQGHIDCLGIINSIIPEQTGVLIWIKYPEQYNKYVVQMGSICINGVSLTIAEKADNLFKVSIIPHTFKVTALNYLKVGDEVNLEFDIIGKYIENLVNPYQNLSVKNNNKSILEQYITQPDF